MFEVRSKTGRFSAILLIGAFAACGGGDAGDAATEGGATGGEPAAAAQVANPGTITGSINFAGDVPAAQPIDMSAEPDCAAKHSSQPMTQHVVVNGGKLANVFVYIKEGLSGNYGPTGSGPEVDQNGCEYIPHMIGVQTGQPVTFRNSDGLLHNIKAQPTNNRPFNISQPTNMTSTQTFNQPDVLIPVQCDVHGWMNMYIGVTSHPYFAVSAADGSFTISNLPPGTYTLAAVHERYGEVTQQITVDPNGTATVTFDFNAGMAGNPVPLGEPFDPHGTHHAHVVTDG